MHNWSFAGGVYNLQLSINHHLLITTEIKCLGAKCVYTLSAMQCAVWNIKAFVAIKTKK